MILFAAVIILSSVLIASYGKARGQSFYDLLMEGLILTPAVSLITVLSIR